ncbi:unnamed protein product, partial [Ectocarpus sp. 8 AP-2014]
STGDRTWWFLESIRGSSPPPPPPPPARPPLGCTDSASGEWLPRAEQNPLSSLPKLLLLLMLLPPLLLPRSAGRLFPPCSQLVGAARASSSLPAAAADPASLGTLLGTFFGTAGATPPSSCCGAVDADEDDRLRTPPFL